jgi:hypothetical protein
MISVDVLFLYLFSSSISFTVACASMQSINILLFYRYIYLLIILLHSFLNIFSFHRHSTFIEFSVFFLFCVVQIGKCWFFDDMMDAIGSSDRHERYSRDTHINYSVFRRKVGKYENKKDWNINKEYMFRYYK